MHSNVWYQAYVFKESANEVKVSMRSVPGAIMSPYPGHPEPFSREGPGWLSSQPLPLLRPTL